MISANNRLVMANLLILSECDDRTTNDVAQWLLRWNVPFVRINTNDAIEVIEISPNSNKLVIKTKGNIYNLYDFTRIWFRRGVFSLKCFSEAMRNAAAFYDTRNVSHFIQAEWDRLREYIFFCLEKKDALGSFTRYNLNKLTTLHIAKDCGLDIPETLISENGSRIAEMLTNKPLITKPISEAYTFKDKEGKMHKMLTTLVSDADIQTSIFPSLVQEKLNKWIELRIVYLCGKCYAGAIFSQNDAKTALDFRNYGATQNRIIPFDLPPLETQKINALMHTLKLNIGSIDMVLTRDMRYVFLEVNPVGNIEMVSKSCNYPIEQNIAQILSNGVETKA